MNWDDPVQRAALIESVGPEEYNRQFEKHREDSTVARINGHRIMPVGTAFGRLFMVEGTGSAFHTQEEAEAFAASV